MHYQKIKIGDNVVEFHNNFLGRETVVLNGQIVSQKASTMGVDHPFTIIETGEKINYILTSKVDGNTWEALLDLSREGEIVEENIKVSHGIRSSKNKRKRSGIKKIVDYDIEEGIEDLIEGLKKTPKDPEIYFYLACGYAIQEKAVEGFEALKNAVAFNLQSVEEILIHDMLAFLRIQKGFEAFLDSNFTEYDTTQLTHLLPVKAPENYTKGAAFYDKKEVFDIYIQHRNREDTPNGSIEKPIVMRLLAEVSGEVLDVGCGYADIATDLIALGIKKYTGIDASARMIELAQSKLQAPNVTLVQTSLESWDYGTSKYNWVIARLVLNYVADVKAIFQHIHKALKKDGCLVFSVEHPVLTSSMNLPRLPGKKESWLVDNYFTEGDRRQDWLNSGVIKYHWTLETYWQLLNDIGFQIEALKEGLPERINFKSEREYQRRKRIPLFLVIKARKC